MHTSLSSNYRPPGRPGVTQIDVDRAADGLLKNGARPSVERIRAITGGSPNTLAPLLDDWWRRLGARVAAGPGAFERLPGSLALMAESFFLHALEEARRAAAIHDARERDALTREQLAAEVRSHVLSAREKELSALLQRQQEEMDGLRKQLESAGRTIAKLSALTFHPGKRRSSQAPVAASSRSAKKKPWKQSRALPSRLQVRKRNAR